MTVRREVYEHVASSLEGWHQRDALVQRGDLLALHTVLLSAQRCVIGALHGLNRVFLANPSMKWEQATANQFRLQPPEIVHELRAGETVLVEIAVFNAGDRAGTNARWNFVVDESIRLEWQGNNAAHRLVSFNARQALGPSPQTAFFAGTEPWPPGDWFVRFFRLTYQPQHPHTGPIPGRLVLELADDRLNARGHRWLPILVVRRDITWPPATSPWPELHRSRRSLSWAIVQPRGHIACRAGVRLDARDILLVANSDGDHPPGQPPAQE